MMKTLPNHQLLVVFEEMGHKSLSNECDYDEALAKGVSSNSAVHTWAHRRRRRNEFDA